MAKRSRQVHPAIILTVSGLLLLGFIIPSTIDDFFLPGSQPGDSGNLEAPTKCDNCHSGYDSKDVEPTFNWSGSMMAQAMRDPLFAACLSVSNQDVPEVGDLCIRCHTPTGWLEGRSTPTDGSGLNASDYDGVHCDFCHRLIKPTPIGINPFPDDPHYTTNLYPLDQDYLATITDIPPTSGNGMYIVDSDNAKRGPFDDAGATHQFYYSPFHKESALCGTCHDVSNPAYSRQSGDIYVANDFGQPAPSFNTYDMFPVERTYSEWLMSDYNSETGIYAPQFGGNKDYVATCQDCHMRDVSGVACNKASGVYRDDLPLHDMTGGNTFIPELIATLYPSDVDTEALDSGIVRARYMLQNAATMEVNVSPDGGDLLATVKVINETGHKLPSGYPEGRRIWINLKAYDSNDNLVYESGQYDPTTAVLDHDDDIKVYEIKPGVDAVIAGLTGLPEGPSFHFVLNNKVYSDNRIPPRGFTNANFESIQSPPVGYAYADGQYWDETQYVLPATTASVEATLYYQTLSKEYVEFLRDNATDGSGLTLYNLWDSHGKSSPEVMTSVIVNTNIDNDGDGYISVDDCNDNDATIHPGATEVCDGVDNNCDGNIDEGVTLTFYEDADSDGFGNPVVTTQACSAPGGFVDNDLDCDDTDPAINPDKIWYADADSDGFGTISVTQASCIQPAGYVDNSLDCNDGNGAIHPGVVEVCDEVDNNCDGNIDEGVLLTFFEDADSDGFGNPDVTTQACSPPGGFVDNDQDCDDTNASINPGVTEILYNSIDDDCDPGTPDTIDVDGDGYNSDVDCDDNNPDIHPGAVEVCDEIDNNCDGNIDEGVTLTFFEDADSDGFGNPDITIQACSVPEGFTDNDLDCNDGDGEIHPDAVEVCDGIDNNCDGNIDEGVTLTFYEDDDSDGFGNPDVTTHACSPPVGFVDNDLDCNDGDGAIHPDATEVCDGIDNNCDGNIDEGVLLTFFEDADSDGYGNPDVTTQACSAPVGYVDNDLDCNDGDGDIHPDAVEVCDGIDNNCDGNIDEGVLLTFFEDADGDGYGNSTVTTQACSVPAGFAENDLDCNDNNNGIYPGAPEICDGLDNDCNSQVDDGLTFIDYYVDADSDGFGDENDTPLSACTPPPGYVDNNLDCNDGNANINPGATEVLYNGIDDDCDPGTPDTIDVDNDGFNSDVDCDDDNNAVYPGAPEVCDGLDNDCDSQIDDGLIFVDYYVDTDSDGFGDENNTPVNACSQPPGYVDNNLDCDDGNANVHPGATEILYNGIDDDCDPGTPDEIDADGDGYNSNEDCDDNNNTVYPGAPEICDGLDNDCNSQIDDGLIFVDYYVDNDSDGFGDENDTPVNACLPPPGYVDNNLDCDDGNNHVYPGAAELCDGIDNNCNGEIDEVSTFVDFYIDADSDGFGDENDIPVNACSQPPGYVDNNLDCDDGNADVHPGAVEILYNGLDDDCDPGTPDTIDADNDGFNSDADCDDSNDAVYPGAPEICDGIDNDCNSQIDDGLTFVDYYVDADSDGFGDVNASPVNACSQPPGYVDNNLDCDDGRANVHPGATEILYNGLDDDCDPGTPDTIDADNDGFNSDVDCDDNNNAIYPGAPEVCDGLDNDCDSQIDDGLVFVNYYVDTDNDGFGDENDTPVSACSQPTGYAANNLDCDDGNSDVHPGATEILYNGVDDDCDPGTPDEIDADGDGYSSNVDCDDSNPDIHPGVSELCDGIDNNCDGNIDEGLTVNLYYADNDGDSYGNPEEIQEACSTPPGFVDNDLDCNDADPEINPDAIEVCDGVDNNCDGNIDEGVTLTFYEDADNDGYGNPDVTNQACSVPPGFTDNDLDCDDTNPAVNPDKIWYVDADSDGFGDINVKQTSCTQPPGFVDNDLDCDDSNSSINPNTVEVCDGVDNNCDGNIDEGVLLTFYEDADSDRYGNPDITTQACSTPNGFVDNDNDCDDTNDNINPGITEILNNGIDDDCDPSTKDTQDADADGYDSDVDCDDNNPDIHPDAVEVCDGIDNNCDGNIDEGISNTFYEDADGDGYGNSAVAVQSCSAPIGFVENDLDCNDSESDINPDAPEVCDGIDNNCNGDVDEGVTFTFYEDSDGDGYGNPAITTQTCSLPEGFAENDLDCDDTDPDKYAGAPALPDGKDNDCDGVIDKLTQTITFNTVPDITEDEETYFLNVASSSGLTITFVINYGDISIDGNSIIILGPGEVSITAFQEGNEGYIAANPVTITFCINPKQPNITSSISNKQLVLESSSETGNQWYLDDATIPGATEQKYTTSIPGIYTVKVTLNNCESEFSEPFEYLPTGVGDIYEATIDVYPNPAEGWITFSIPDDISATDWKLSILDAKGVYVIRSSSVSFNGGKYVQYLSERVDGLYTYILYDAEEKYVFRGQFVLK